MARSEKKRKERKTYEKEKMKHKLPFFHMGQCRVWEDRGGVGSVDEAAEFIFNTKLKAYSVFFPFKNRPLTS